MPTKKPRTTHIYKSYPYRKPFFKAKKQHFTNKPHFKQTNTPTYCLPRPLPSVFFTVSLPRLLHRGGNVATDGGKQVAGHTHGPWRKSKAALKVYGGFGKAARLDVLEVLGRLLGWMFVFCYFFPGILGRL